MDKIIYFDNAASTKPLEEVIEINNELMRKYYANPSAKHILGKKSEDYIIEAKKIIADSLRCESGEIIFTSGGTEANNMAILGIAKAYGRKGRHIITSAVEHSAVKEPMLKLKESGYEITFLPVDKYGQIDKDEFLNSIREDTILISIMYVNNEIGTFLHAEELAASAKKKNENVIFHTDAVQAYGKYEIRPKKYNIDLLSASSHKFNGPKGAGFLYARKGINLPSYIYGGGQQNGFRSGTLDTYSYAATGTAARIAYKELNIRRDVILKIRKYIINELNNIEDINLNTLDNDDFAPHIVSFSVKGVKSEVLLHSLEDKNIYVSSGSACSTHRVEKSSTLQAVGLSKELQDGTIRLSFSHDNMLEEAEYFIGVLKELIPILKKFKRK